MSEYLVYVYVGRGKGVHIAIYEFGKGVKVFDKSFDAEQVRFKDAREVRHVRGFEEEVTTAIYTSKPCVDVKEGLLEVYKCASGSREEQE